MTQDTVGVQTPSDSARDPEVPSKVQESSPRSRPHRDDDDALSSPCPLPRKRALSSSSPPAPSELKRRKFLSKDSSSDVYVGPTVWELDEMSEGERKQALRAMRKYPCAAKKDENGVWKSIGSSSSDDSSAWPMEKESSEDDSNEATQVINNGLFGLEHVLIRKGHNNLIPSVSDKNGASAQLPFILYVNVKNGLSFQSVVDKVLFSLERVIDRRDPEQSLWRNCDFVANTLYEFCFQEASESKDDFRILHRHGEHKEITDEPLTSDKFTPWKIKEAVSEEWERLVARFGDFNDLQNELRLLIEKAINLLCEYMKAIARRDLVTAMKLNYLLGPLRDALDELCVSEYVIRELHTVGIPQFNLAIDATE